MTIDDRTPILIGVGEASERIDAEGYEGVGPAELAGRAARAALADAGADVAALAARIDVIAAIRQFEISTPGAKAPFGCSDNLPRSIGKRIGADPARAILEVTGGQGPQHLVTELFHSIAAGETTMALIAGSESISTVRHLMTKGESRDWSETVGGTLEDRGYGMDGLITGEMIRHGMRIPITLYALFENARRGRLGMDRQSYAQAMGELFAPFTRVAHDNPHAMSQEVFTAEELATVTPRNRLVADPFPRRMVARDQANQGAAALMTSVGVAREMGVPEDRWVYLHGGADVKERTVIERRDLDANPAAVLAARRALELAGVGISDVAVLDLYSCFPVAVFNVRDGLGVKADDPRPLTVTGGLPFFGGAGNNYSMHAQPGAIGFVGANGGFLSKYSAGVYSTTPKAWTPFSSKDLQAEIDGWPAPEVIADASGDGWIETFTIDYGQAAPRGLVVGRKPTGERFGAVVDDPALVEQMIATDPMGAAITVALGEKDRNTVTSLVAQ
jgi:acetyl-CoA C-acetyltransferase